MTLQLLPLILDMYWEKQTGNPRKGRIEICRRNIATILNTSGNVKTLRMEEWLKKKQELTELENK